MDDNLRNLLYQLDHGKQNDLRQRVTNLERLIASVLGNTETDPNTNQGVDDDGILRTVSDDLDLQTQVGTANGLEINWWLPLTLADDDVSYINCQVIKTISDVKYLYVGGVFARIGGIAAVNIARYNFSTRQWAAIDDGSLNGEVWCMAFDSADDLYIGGGFTNASGVATADYIAKLVAGVWTAVNGGVNGVVGSIVFDGSDVKYIGGAFTDAGGDADADYIARDDGAGSWENVNGGVGNAVRTMVFSPGGVLHIGGDFTDAGGDPDADYIARDDGAGSWENVNGGVGGAVRILVFDASGVLYTGGAFTDAGGDADADYIARDDGAGSWENVGGGLNGTVTAMVFDAAGFLICGGYFTDASGVAEADRVAWFDGQSWQALSNGGGLSGLSGIVNSVVVDANRTVYAGGDFSTAGTIQCKGLAAFVRPLADALDMIAGLFEQYQARSGVTNGNSHDHSGGDGAQINHTGLANIGTNTHAQIDTHLALKRWATTIKAANESVNNSALLQNDDELSVALVASGVYAIRGRLWFNTLAAADFKYRFYMAGGTLLYCKHTYYPAGSSTGTTTIETAIPTVATSVLGTLALAGCVEFEALVVVDASDRNFVVQWAQNTATVGNTTVLAGSFIEACPAG